ncbi:MAG: hypothetical protein JF887_01400 [Candidatus Dormibacteraeota bacterium]|uniref:Peptidase S53 domain-containing protein n=1 Tax=Candidatus Amunia macphersoniae TaxID=3127014 RepID=A0A934KK96_9BACT|nr:hypothetical protein [Candidatus Dormibacteraeota bacterium]
MGSATTTLRAVRLLAGLATASALLLSPAGILPAAAAPTTAPTGTASSIGLCGSPQHAHRTCLVRALTVNGQRYARPFAAPSFGYTPNDIRSAYGLLGATGGANQTVAIIDAYDNPNAESDLAAYRAQWGLPACTTANGCFRKTDEHGGQSFVPASRNNPNDPSYGWATEIDLDVQAVSAACPLCHILLVEGANSSDASLMNAITTAATLGATGISLSLGGCEQAPDQQYFDSVLHNTGLPITAGSGDSGFLSANNPSQQDPNRRCVGPSGTPLNGAPSFPASSPYVTAVGGTTLTHANSPRGWSETAWAYSATKQSGGGSGCSTSEPKPAWQHDSGCANRMVADVAADGDPQTGLAVYDTWDANGWSAYGGTSLSAPLIAGITALSGGLPAGTSAGQAWYKPGGAVNDVILGSNAPLATDCLPQPYLCNAGLGYDGPTGVGSPAGVLTPVAPPAAAGVYTPTAPFRLADTRAGSGRQLQGQSLGQGQSVNVQLVGVDGVPANATAAVLNVTTTNTSSGSYLTAYPGGTNPPLASNLNFTAGQTVANLVTVPIGANGGVGIFNQAGSADVIVDLEGYFVPGTGPAGLYNPLSPVRVTDTRPGSGQANTGSTLAPDGTLAVQVLGVGGVPQSGVSAVVLNVTAASPSEAGYLTAFADGTVRPLASNLNFAPGQVVPNRVIVPVGADGKVSIYNWVGSTDVIVDTGGWFTDASNPLATGSRFTPLAPTRVADTRRGSGLPMAGATLNGGDTRSVAVVAPAGLPAGVMAVAVNVTVAGPSSQSYLTVYPDATAQPLASDLNWVAGQVVPNLAVARLGSNGALAVYNNLGRVDVIVDVFGYWS